MVEEQRQNQNKTLKTLLPSGEGLTSSLPRPMTQVDSRNDTHSPMWDSIIFLIAISAPGARRALHCFFFCSMSSAHPSVTGSLQYTVAWACNLLPAHLLVTLPPLSRKVGCPVLGSYSPPIRSGPGDSSRCGEWRTTAHSC